MLPNFINVPCAIITIVCLALCLLANYELIPDYCFLIGLIVGCTVFFGAISANIFEQQVENVYNSYINWYNNALAGHISYKNGNTTNTAELSTNTFTSDTTGPNGAHSTTSFSNGTLSNNTSNGLHKSSSSESLNIRGITHAMNVW